MKWDIKCNLGNDVHRHGDKAVLLEDVPPNLGILQKAQKLAQGGVFLNQDVVGRKRSRDE